MTLVYRDDFVFLHTNICLSRNHVFNFVRFIVTLLVIRIVKVYLDIFLLLKTDLAYAHDLLYDIIGPFIALLPCIHLTEPFLWRLRKYCRRINLRIVL